MTLEYNGLHVMIDAIVDRSENLVQPQPGVEMLEDIIDAIDMTMILPPVTVKFSQATSEMKRVLEGLESEDLGESNAAKDLKERLEERQNKAYGYSTFVMIAESHLSMHTFPELNYFSFDCYSCKSFDVDAVIKVMKSHFSLAKLEMQVVKRRIPRMQKA